MPHSGLGIGSFIVGILVGLFEFMVIILAGLAEASTEGGLNEDSPEAFMIGVGVLAGFFLAFIGLGLGVAAFFQADRNKVFAILGTIFNGTVVLGLMALIVLGLAME